MRRKRKPPSNDWERIRAFCSQCRDVAGQCYPLDPPCFIFGLNPRSTASEIQAAVTRECASCRSDVGPCDADCELFAIVTTSPGRHELRV